jgi:shikimate kinase
VALPPGVPVVLVGMMGAGKTTVGRALAHRLGWEFADTDELVEAWRGQSVREVFAEEGEDGFRAAETAVLDAALATTAPGVVGAGGGAVTQEVNRGILRSSRAHVVWLRAEVGELAGRLAGATDRPLLDGDPEQRLRALLSERAAWYAEVADAVVDVDGRSVDDIVEEILSWA